MATACSRDCSKGFYCDPATRACETCLSICDRLRDTMDYCRSVLECKDYHHSMTTSPSIIIGKLLSSSPSLSPSSDDDDGVDGDDDDYHRFVIHVSLTVFGFCVILAVFVFVVLCLRRRRSQNCISLNSWKLPTSVPVSSVEQLRTDDALSTGKSFLFHLPHGRAAVEMVPLRMHPETR